MDSTLIGLDPLFLTNVKLFVKDVLHLKRTTGFEIDCYKFFNHYIKFAEICGIIVGVETNSRMAIYTIDDGTGTIPCGYWIDDYSFQPLKIGTSVRILGKITTHRDIRQITIYNLHELFDPNQEVLHFCQVMAYRKRYEENFIIPTSINNCTEELKKQFARENIQKSLPSTQFDDEDNFTDQLMEAYLAYLQALGGDSFAFKVPYEDSKLMELAKKSLKAQYHNIDIEKRDISECFDSAFKSLVRQGNVVMTSKQNQKRMFRVVDGAALKDLVMKIITETTADIEDFQGGIRFEYILAKIVEIPGYTSFSKYKDKVKSAINELVEQSYLYPVNDKEFKIIY